MISRLMSANVWLIKLLIMKAFRFLPSTCFVHNELTQGWWLPAKFHQHLLHFCFYICIIPAVISPITFPTHYLLHLYTQWDFTFTSCFCHENGWWWYFCFLFASWYGGEEIKSIRKCRKKITIEIVQWYWREKCSFYINLLHQDYCTFLL